MELYHLIGELVTKFKRLVSISGEFVVVNKHLLNDLTNMGIWTQELKNQVIYHNGSIQMIEGISDDLKYIYRYITQALSILWIHF